MTAPHGPLHADCAALALRLAMERDTARALIPAVDRLLAVLDRYGSVTDNDAAVRDLIAAREQVTL